MQITSLLFIIATGHILAKSREDCISYQLFNLHFKENLGRKSLEQAFEAAQLISNGYNVQIKKLRWLDNPTQSQTEYTDVVVKHIEYSERQLIEMNNKALVESLKKEMWINNKLRKYSHMAKFHFCVVEEHKSIVTSVFIFMESLYDDFSKKNKIDNTDAIFDDKNDYSNENSRKFKEIPMFSNPYTASQKPKEKTEEPFLKIHSKAIPNLQLNIKKSNFDSSQAYKELIKKSNERGFLKNKEVLSAYDLYKNAQTIEKLNFWLMFAQALDQLRAEKIVHADIKPENIMTVDATLGWIKLIDFGISGSLGGLSPSVLGTEGYIWPGRISNNNSKLSYLQDFWAFGMVFNYLEIDKDFFQKLKNTFVNENEKIEYYDGIKKTVLQKCLTLNSFKMSKEILKFFCDLIIQTLTYRKNDEKLTENELNKRISEINLTDGIKSVINEYKAKEKILDKKNLNYFKNDKELISDSYFKNHTELPFNERKERVSRISKRNFLEDKKPEPKEEESNFFMKIFSKIIPCKDRRNII